jgi:site-specific recombinase XerD
VPLDFVTVQAFDAYGFERLAVPRAASSDFVLVNLFREPVGAPMVPDSVNDLITAAAQRAGLSRAVTPHQLRHAPSARNSIETSPDTRITRVHAGNRL